MLNQINVLIKSIHTIQHGIWVDATRIKWVRLANLSYRWVVSPTLDDVEIWMNFGLCCITKILAWLRRSRRVIATSMPVEFIHLATVAKFQSLAQPKT